MACGASGGGEVLGFDFSDCDCGDRAAGRIQPGSDPLHALHGRTDLWRDHAAETGAEILGGVLQRDRFSTTWLARAGGDGGGGAAEFISGAHAGSERSRDSSLD